MVMVRGAQRRRISVSFYLFIGGGSGASELSRSKLLSNFAVCISIAFFVCTFGVVFAVAPSPTGTDRDSGGGTSDGGWRGSTGVTFVLRLLFVAAGTGRDNGGGNGGGGKGAGSGRCGKDGIVALTYASHKGRDDRFCRAVESAVRNGISIAP